MGVGDQPHAPAASTHGKDPVPIVQEAGWPPGPVWTDAENLFPTGIRSRTVQPVAQSLYRLSYAGPPNFLYLLLLKKKNCTWDTRAVTGWRWHNASDGKT